MPLLEKQYEVIKDGPKEINWDDYYDQIVNDYEKLLMEKGDSEQEFQSFFEQNPSFMPGALQLFGQSGHYPYRHALISQPQIGHIFRRIPDFMWLAQDSLTFCPVLIEIEKPNKSTFTKSRDTTAEFNQALGQIEQWNYLLKNPSNIHLFYDFFDIPSDIRKKEFNPQYALIYGRRSEYDQDELMRGIRAEKQKNNIAIMSYDRLKPLSDYRQFVTCKVKETQYIVSNIPPTYRYRADCAKELTTYENFYDSIDYMKYTTQERKQFLKDRFEYWINYGKNGSGMIRGMEGE